MYDAYTLSHLYHHLSSSAEEEILRSSRVTCTRVTSNLFVPQQSNDNTITWLKGTTVAVADYVKFLPPIKTLSSIVHLVFYLMPLHVISTVLLLQPVPVVQLPSVPSTT